MLKQRLEDDLRKILKTLNFETSSDTFLSIPNNSSFGDYSTNIALQLAKNYITENKQSVLEIANKISENLKDLDYLEKVEVVPPGFINFYFKIGALMENLQNVCNYSSLVKSEIDQESANPKKIFVEYASFNALKPVHIGHLRNITIGESIVRLLQAEGHQVFKATYSSDIGLPAAKVVWAIKQLQADFKKAKKVSVSKKSEFLGKAYVVGNKAYEEDEVAKEEINSINKKIYERDPEVVPVWQEILGWTFSYFNLIYQIVGSKFDAEFLESEVEGIGKGIVEKYLGEVFVEDQGAVIFPGEKYGLHNRVFISSQGNPTYEAKDIGLARKEYDTFPFDRAIHVVGNEQSDYFKVVFKALEMIDPELAKKEEHLPYGFVTLPDGKMSSRKGNVITLEELLEKVKGEVKKIMKNSRLEEKEQIIDFVSLGAIKFTMLKFAPATKIVFDIKKSVTLQGDSGPYVQYTYARAKSVLRNASFNYQPQLEVGDMEPEERALLQKVEYFNGIVEQASKELNPTIITTFLLDISQNFNLFYQKHPIIKGDKDKVMFRLTLTCAVAVILKQGLYLLGIEAPERM